MVCTAKDGHTTPTICSRRFQVSLAAALASACACSKTWLSDPRSQNSDTRHGGDRQIPRKPTTLGWLWGGAYWVGSYRGCYSSSP